MLADRRLLVNAKEGGLELRREGPIKAICRCSLYEMVPTLPRKDYVPICYAAFIVKPIERLMHFYDMLFCNADVYLAEESGID